MTSALLAVALLGLLYDDPQRLLKIIKRMRRTILPLAMLVFVIDLFAPLGIAVPVLYVVPVVIAALLWSLEWGAGVALLATLLTYGAYLYGPGGGDLSVAQINRLLAAILIWSGLLIGWILSHLQSEIKEFYERYKDR